MCLFLLASRLTWTSLEIEARWAGLICHGVNSIGPHRLLESPGIADGFEVFVVESEGRDFSARDLASPFSKLESCFSVSACSEVEI